MCNCVQSISDSVNTCSTCWCLFDNTQASVQATSTCSSKQNAHYSLIYFFEDEHIDKQVSANSVNIGISKASLRALAGSDDSSIFSIMSQR